MKVNELEKAKVTVEHQELAQKALASAGLENDVVSVLLLAAFVAAGGNFHGPQIETATISVAQLVTFLRTVIMTEV